MQTQPLTLKDRTLFERHRLMAPHTLAVYSFASVWMWRSCFDIRYAFVHNALCLFFQDKAGCFMALPPLGERDAGVLDACFRHMESINHNPDISRIENVEEAERPFFEESGWRVYEKSKDYLVSRCAIATLRGDRLKHKRNLYNAFVKRGSAAFRDYAPSDKKAVLKLYRRWQKERSAKYDDRIYRAMLEDSFGALRCMLDDIAYLGVTAKVVEIDGRVVAFTSGCPICPDIFCIHFEIADLAYKGLAQYIFTMFARSLSGFAQLNIMDDSGLANIRRAKGSFHPTQLVPSLTAVKSL